MLLKFKNTKTQMALAEGFGKGGSGSAVCGASENIRV